MTKDFAGYGDQDGVKQQERRHKVRAAWPGLVPLAYSIPGAVACVSALEA